MKKITFLFLFILLTGVLSAQPWSEQNSGVSATLTSVWSVNSSVVWVCGYTGTVLYTSNGGTTWLNRTGNGIPTTAQLINITGFPNNNSTDALVTGYVSSPANTWVWKTTNSGVNWTQVFNETGGFIDAMWMSSATNGYMVGDPVGGRWSLWKTTNGGTNWDSTGLRLVQAGTEGGYNNSMIYAPPYIWFGTNNTRIYFSTNNGTSWTIQATTGELNSYAIWFHPQFINGQGLFGGAALWQTTNYGTNWTSLTSMGSGNFGGITSTQLLTDYNLFQPIWCIRQTNIIYFSSNYGANWISEYTNPTTTTQYRHISFAYPGRGIWTVGTLGKISYHTPLMDIKKIGSEIPENYSLSQNYPNPFNPATKIKFSIPGRFPTGAFGNDKVVVLKVYDISGKEIAVLVNQKQNPGTYEVSFDGAKIPSGVYFYTLSAGDYKETKKMILMK